MGKMSVIDIMQGTFLNIKEILVEATNIDISANDDLPLQLCTDCISKITGVYYFCMQVRKADDVLRRLANKLKGYQEVVEEECEMENNFDETDEIADDRILEEEEVVLYDYQDLENFEENENKITYEIQQDDIKTCSKNLEKISNIESSLVKDDDADLLDTEKEIAMKTVESELTECEPDYYDIQTESGDDDFYLQKDLIESMDPGVSDSEEAIINATVITRVKTPKTGIRNLKPTTGYRHKQPRVTSPLLNDFDCAICQDSFGRQQDLVHHVRESHPNSKAFKCRVCANLFSHIQSLSRHMNTHKPAVILHDCSTCSKSFVRADDLKRHVRIHTGERPYVCTFCDKSYQQHSELKYHVKKHLNCQTTTLECDECKQNYSSRSGLYLHKRKHHRQVGSDNELSYDYSLHDKSFHLPPELKGHETNQFPTESIKYTECDEHFTSHNSLYTPKRKYHRTESRAEKENEYFTSIEDDEEKEKENENQH